MFPKFDKAGKVCYNKRVGSKKGGIIIEYKSKNELLKRGLILIPMALLSLTAFSNTLYANNNNSVTGTKERIKEIKIVEDINIDKLIRNKKERIVIPYTRQTISTTSRGAVTSRDKQTTAKVQMQNKKIVKKANKKTNKKTEQHANVTVKNVTISKNMNLTKRTGLSKVAFKKVMKNLKPDTSKFFYNNADTIYDVCKKYQINEIFFCGLISAESGWDIASSHRNAHNYISLMSNGKLVHYSSTKEGLEVAAKKLHQNYLTPGGKFYGGKTLAGIKKKFCPASSTWTNLVYGRMQQVITAVKKVS